MSVKYEIHIDKENGFRSLYALDDIRQGEVISDLPHIGLTNPDIYSIQVMPGVHLDCRDHPVGATNHSCLPNSSIRGNRLVAFACIKAGEEITIDYKKTESKLAAPFICHCGAKNCKGRIE